MLDFLQKDKPAKPLAGLQIRWVENSPSLQRHLTQLSWLELALRHEL